MTPTDLLLQLALFSAALLANLLSALAGGGAGLVQLPVLILLGLSFPLGRVCKAVCALTACCGAP